MAETQRARVGQVTEDGVWHLLPYVSPTVVNRSACGFQEANLNAKIDSLKTVTCKACQETDAYAGEKIPVIDKYAIWHFFYRHWYDNKRLRRYRRAAVWGWANDVVCRILWPKSQRTTN